MTRGISAKVFSPKRNRREKGPVYDVPPQEHRWRALDFGTARVFLEYALSRVEAVNNKIKLTVRMGYGFCNVDNPIALVMLRCSNLPITLPGRG